MFFAILFSFLTASSPEWKAHTNELETCVEQASVAQAILAQAILFMTSVAHAQGEVHSGIVVVCTFASPSAVPWYARMDFNGRSQVGPDHSRATLPF